MFTGKMDMPDFSQTFVEAFDSWSFPPEQLVAYRRLLADRKPYLICITPRSGSTYLRDLLCRTGSAGRPGEYLNPIVLGSWLAKRRAVDENVDSLLQYLTWVITHQPCEKGAAGITASYVQFQPLIETGLDGLLFDHFRKVRLHRQDIVQQAVSLYLATDTGLWHTHQRISENHFRDSPDVSYDEARIRTWLNHIWEQEQGWDQYLRSRSEVAPKLFYESLEHTPLRVLRRIMRLLRLEIHHIPIPGRSKVRKIGGPRNIDWAMRFVSSRENVEYMGQLGIPPERYITVGTV